mmetsp:Transcript_110759/g.191965  ORF Transcript_110759/g.191965 Transcript_110759/m.191965 type:complete len:243 (+) Transcript_110759:728-1456(+)
MASSTFSGNSLSSVRFCNASPCTFFRDVCASAPASGFGTSVTATAFVASSPPTASDAAALGFFAALSLGFFAALPARARSSGFFTAFSLGFGASSIFTFSVEPLHFSVFPSSFSALSTSFLLLNVTTAAVLPMVCTDSILPHPEKTFFISNPSRTFGNPETNTFLSTGWASAPTSDLGPPALPTFFGADSSSSLSSLSAASGAALAFGSALASDFSAWISSTSSSSLSSSSESTGLAAAAFG